MYTLKECYKDDFNKLMSIHEDWNISSKLYGDFNVIVNVHFDFNSNSKFISFYIPCCEKPLDLINNLLEKKDEALNISNSVTMESHLIYEQNMSSSTSKFSGRIYFYYEGEINKYEFNKIKNHSKSKGLYLHCRDKTFLSERSKFEIPLAFISHDSKDKKIIAKKIADGLQEKLCSVWYDEYSLKVGDSLREQIEKGIKECKKCILILSENFFANKGWTKVEFNSIFTREIIETKNLVLPVWCGISKEQVYEYSPQLADRFGLNWDNGLDYVVRNLYNVIMEK